MPHDEFQRLINAEEELVFHDAALLRKNIACLDNPLDSRILDLRHELEGKRSLFIALCYVLPYIHNLRLLWLDENGIDEYQLAEISIPLRRVVTLTNLSFARNKISDNGVAMVADLLEKFTGLKKLFLWRCNFTSVGMGVLSLSLRGLALESLDVSFNNFGDVGTASLAEALPTLTALRSLGVCGCGITASGALVLSDSVKHIGLVKFSAGFNALGDDGVSLLASAVQGIASLRVLDLTACDFGVQGLGCIIGAINRIRLAALHIGGNAFGDEGVEFLEECLDEACELRELFMWDCALTEQCAPHLAKVVLNLCKLHTLGIGHNAIGDDGAKSLAIELSLRKFRKLHLNDNGISDPTKLILRGAFKLVKQLVL